MTIQITTRNISQKTNDIVAAAVIGRLKDKGWDVIHSTEYDNKPLPNQLKNDVQDVYQLVRKEIDDLDRRIREFGQNQNQHVLGRWVNEDHPLLFLDQDGRINISSGKPSAFSQVWLLTELIKEWAPTENLDIIRAYASMNNMTYHMCLVTNGVCCGDSCSYLTRRRYRIDYINRCRLFDSSIYRNKDYPDRWNRCAECLELAQ